MLLLEQEKLLDAAVDIIALISIIIWTIVKRPRDLIPVSFQESVG